LYKDELSKLGLVNSSGRTIGDQIALSIGSLGENMSLRRAIIFNIKQGDHLSWYMHGSLSDPLNNCHFGKYGSLVTLSLTQKNENYKVVNNV
jgi:elongation factor Ts